MKWCETPRSLQLLHVLDVFHVKGVEKAGRIGKSDLHRGGHTSLHGPGGEVAGGLVGSFQPSHVDLGGLSRKGLWSGSGSLVLGHHALRICLELDLTAPSINMPSIFRIFPTQIPVRKKLTCRGERLWQAKTYKNIFNSLGRTLTPKYTHRILDLHCDIEVCGYLPFGTNLVEPLGMLSWHCPYLAPPQSGLVRCSSIGWIQRFDMELLNWLRKDVEMTCEDLQFAIWILLDVFFVTSKQLQLSRLLTSLEAASVFCCVAWEVEVPISLQGGEKGSHKWRNLPWVEVFQWKPDSSLGPIPFYRFDQLDMLVFEYCVQDLYGQKTRKAYSIIPSGQVESRSEWMMIFSTQPTWQRWWVVSAKLWETILLEPFFAWHFFCMAKTGWDWQRPHQGSFDATSAFDALLLVMAKTFDAFPKHGVSRSCIRSFIGTNARAGSFYFRMGAAIPSSSAVLWGHGFSFLGLTP